MPKKEHTRQRAGGIEVKQVNHRLEIGKYAQTGGKEATFSSTDADKSEENWIWREAKKLKFF